MSGRVSVEIVEGPIPAGLAWREEGAEGAVGAEVVFRGMVRGEEAGEKLSALEYEVYEPMAQKELTRLCERMIERHGVRSIGVVHSKGRVGVGECSFVLRVASAHRAEALAAMGEFIDVMKRDVPIWKRVVRASGA